MSRPIEAFLDEVVQFLQDEILPEAYTQTRYFDSCKVRVDQAAEQVKVCQLSYCYRDPEDRIWRRNSLLDRSEIWLEFQFPGKTIRGSWTEALTQCTIGLHVPEIDTPFIYKWEARGDTSGALKADERFDESDYLAVGISAKDAIERAIWEHLEQTIPRIDDRTTEQQIEPILLKTMYNDDHEILYRLRPLSE